MIKNYSDYSNKLPNQVPPPTEQKGSSPSIGEIRGIKTHAVKLLAKAMSSAIKSFFHELNFFEKPTVKLDNLHKDVDIGIKHAFFKHQIKKVHESSKVNSALFHLAVGKDFAAPLRNVAKSSILESDKVLEEAKDLFRTCLEQENKKGKKLVANLHTTLETAKLDGICTGFRIDMASEYLQGTSLGTILNNNRKGANEKAAANHAVYTALSGLENTLQAQYEKRLLIPLARMNQETFVQRDVLYSLAVLSHIHLLDDTIKDMAFDKLKSLITSKSQQEGVLGKAMGQLVQDIKKDLKTLEDMGIKEAQIADKGKFKAFLVDRIHRVQPQATKAELDKALRGLDILVASLEVRRGMIELAKEDKSQKASSQTKTQEKSEPAGRWERFKNWIASFLGWEPKQPATSRPTDYISDPSLRHEFRALFEDSVNRDRSEYVCQVRGITQQAASIGHSSAYDSDEAFVNRFQELDGGFYGLDFYTGKGAHAISYIKDSKDPNSGGYIIDPNFGAVRCQDAEHTKKLFKKLLSEYAEPLERHPKAKKLGKPHHNLAIWKVEKLNIS